MFTLTKLGVTIDHVNIIDALSFTSPASGVVSILGPNGAGKSTLMKALAGGIAHHGEKCLNNAWPPSQQIAFMPQDYLVKSSLSVLDCVLLGQREHLSWRVSAAQKQRVVDTLERLSICHLRDRPMSSLSGGQQQLVLLAQRLSMTPRLLLLDEPTSALDLQHQLDVMAFIRQYAQDTGALVLCSLHDLTLAARFSDHVVMLKQGKLIQHGMTQDVITQSTVRQVYNIECDLLAARDDKLIVAPYKATTSPRIASTF